MQAKLSGWVCSETSGNGRTGATVLSDTGTSVSQMAMAHVQFFPGTKYGTEVVLTAIPLSVIPVSIRCLLQSDSLKYSISSST